MNVAEFQKTRIVNQLLLIEDHLSAAVEKKDAFPVCRDCLQEKHLRLLTLLTNECKTGVCTIEVQKFMSSITDWAEGFKKKLNGNLTTEEMEGILKEARDFRKQLDTNEANEKGME